MKFYPCRDHDDGPGAWALAAEKEPWKRVFYWPMPNKMFAYGFAAFLNGNAGDAEEFRKLMVDWDYTDTDCKEALDERIAYRMENGHETA